MIVYKCTKTNNLTILFIFFMSPGMHQSHYLVGCHDTGIHSLVISFLIVLRCLNIWPQAVSLTWIMVSGSSSSKLRSLKLTILRFKNIHTRNTHFTTRKCDITKKNLLRKIISSLSSTALSSFLIIFFAKKIIRDKF